MVFSITIARKSLLINVRSTLDMFCTFSMRLALYPVIFEPSIRHAVI